MGATSEKIQKKNLPPLTADKGVNSNVVAQFDDNRPEAIAQRKWNQQINESPQVRQLMAVQEMSSGHPVQLAAKDTQIVQREYDKTNFDKIKGLVATYSKDEVLIANVDDAGAFNQKLSSFKGYAALEADEKTMVMTQVKMKIKHATMATVVPEDDNDIRKNFNK